MAKVSESARTNGGKSVKFEKNVPAVPGDDTVVVESKGKNGEKRLCFKRRSDK